jgi:hypothetical protein
MICTLIRNIHFFVKLVLTFFVIIIFANNLNAQQQSSTKSSFCFETAIHLGYIVRNSGEVPHNKTPVLLTINPSFQTFGNDDWHQLYGFPRAGCRITIGSLGNNKELGSIVGLTPNITLKTSQHKWYFPTINMGLGLAWFSKPYNTETNPGNFYIGSHITALAEASIQVEPKLNHRINLLAGIKVIHCSNSHYQVPNLGMNLISIYGGILINSADANRRPVKREIDFPTSRVQFNFRSGIGIHELSRTLGPAGTPKYTIVVNDFYLSKRYGKISNVHAGIEVNYYKSYYNYIVTNNFFEKNQKLNATVITAFLAHELMIKHFSLLAQGGINLHNKFYNAYISQYKSEQGLSLTLKKVFSSRIGLQYYIFDPAHNTRRNIFFGAYIKANFGQADFACFQAGVVF